MATATVKTEEKEVQVVRTEIQEVKTIVLELTEVEAKSLALLFGKIGGSFQETPRKYIDNINNALREKGYHWDEIISKAGGYYYKEVFKEDVKMALYFREDTLKFVE